MLAPIAMGCLVRKMEVQAISVYIFSNLIRLFKPTPTAFYRHTAQFNYNAHYMDCATGCSLTFLLPLLCLLFHSKLFSSVQAHLILVSFGQNCTQLFTLTSGKQSRPMLFLSTVCVKCFQYRTFAVFDSRAVPFRVSKRFVPFRSVSFLFFLLPRIVMM